MGSFNLSELNNPIRPNFPEFFGPPIGTNFKIKEAPKISNFIEEAFPANRYWKHNFPKQFSYVK